MKTVEFTLPLFSFKPPYQQAMVVVGADGIPIAFFPASTVPNWQRPKQADRPNLDEYPVICGGMYRGRYSATGHRQSRPALVFEDNGDIPIYQGGNPRFPKQGKHANYIHVHEGGSVWRGSAGCPTLAVGGGVFLGEMFEEGEEMNINVPDPFWFVFEGR